MKLNDLAKKVGKSAPYVMVLQKKYGLPVCKDYPTGYAMLVKKLIYLSICSVPVKEIKSLLSKEKKLLELFTQVCAVRLHPCGGAVTGRERQR